MNNRKKITVPPEVLQAIQNILRSGKDAEISCDRDGGIVIREVEKRKYNVVASGQR